MKARRKTHKKSGEKNGEGIHSSPSMRENEYYIHRIGRTGRAKKHGVAYTLLGDFPSRMRLDAIVRNTRSQVISATVDETGHVKPVEGK